MMLTAGSLCSGYGGLDLAVEEMFGAETRWFAEFEDAPAGVFSQHWPGIQNLGDMTKVDWSAVEPVDIIHGGYPCQPFSLAGRRAGTSDERHLWPFIIPALAVLRPEWVVFENVRGHLSMGMDHVLCDLSYLGYAVEWRLVAASDVGAPHRRQRVFIVGRRKSE